jgi:hypothetical protein
MLGARVPFSVIVAVGFAVPAFAKAPTTQPAYENAKMDDTAKKCTKGSHVSALSLGRRSSRPAEAALVDGIRTHRIGIPAAYMRKAFAATIFLLLWCGGPAAAPAHPDRTVAAFLLACAKTSEVWSDCSFEVTTIGLYDQSNMLGTHSACPPRSSSEAQAKLRTVSVVNWLSAHPEMHSRDESDGILAALRALYPCQ